MKRIILKLATGFERVNLYEKGKVRARSITLEVLNAEIEDTIEVCENLNPFRTVNSFEPTSMTDSILNDLRTSTVSIKANKKDLLRIYCLSQLLNQEIIRIEERNLAKRTLSNELGVIIDELIPQTDTSEPYR
jgi:hypothetical protein